MSEPLESFDIFPRGAQSLVGSWIYHKLDLIPTAYLPLQMFDASWRQTLPTATQGEGLFIELYPWFERSTSEMNEQSQPHDPWKS